MTDIRNETALAKLVPVVLIIEVHVHGRSRDRVTFSYIASPIQIRIIDDVDGTAVDGFVLHYKRSRARSLAPALFVQHPSEVGLVVRKVSPCDLFR